MSLRPMIPTLRAPARNANDDDARNILGYNSKGEAPMIQAHRFLARLATNSPGWLVWAIGISSLLTVEGCGVSKPTTRSHGASDAGGGSANSTLVSDSGTTPICVWRDAMDAGVGFDASRPADAFDAAAAGLCPLIHPSIPTFYSGDSQSPCPLERPSLSAPHDCCPTEYAGKLQCVYANNDNAATGVQSEYYCKCYDSALWNCNQVACAQSGEGCLANAGAVSSGPEVTLANGLDAGVSESCREYPDVTGQELLAQHIGIIAQPCLSYCSENSGLLTVYFENARTRSFVLSKTTGPFDPTSFQPLYDCIQQKLSNLALDCAQGYTCATVDLAKIFYMICGG
jgi:hypothetical protein